MEVIFLSMRLATISIRMFVQGEHVLLLRWISFLSGGKLVAGVAQKQVTTVLGNLALHEFCHGLSQIALTKEKAQYFTLPRIENTPMHQLLPQMTVSCKDNKATQNGEWLLLSDSQKLKVWAFISALEELEVEMLKGNEKLKEVLEKMISAATEVRVTVCVYEDDNEFLKNYQDGEDADHDQMQKTNARFTNRGKMFMRARIQVGKKKDGVTTHDIVAYFNDLEAKKKIKTTFAKNRVTSADDVKRVEKAYGSLQTWHLSFLYEKLEYSEEHGPTPLSQWSASRHFIAIVESDGDIATFVLKILEHILFGPDDPASKLRKEKVLESSRKLLSIMKALVLEYKMMRDLMKCLETKPLAPPAKMKADFDVIRKCLDFTAFKELEENTSGILQNLTLPAQMFYELCSKIISQKSFGKFAEAEQNNPSYQKMYNSTILAELSSPITTKWEDAHHEFIPKLEKVEWKDDEPTGSDEPGEVKLTRNEAKKRVATADRDGYVKNFILTGDDAMDRQNLQAFVICKTTIKDAPENLETKAWPDILLNHDLASPSIVLNTVSYAFKL
jgi:hypothetical protein